MKAVTFDNFGMQDHPQFEEVPTPKPGPGEVLIQIKYAGVNPVDWKLIEGYLRKRLPHQFPIIPGWDAAGVIAEVGPQVTEFKVGDEVYAYCRKYVVQWGTYAEYVAIDEKSVALKPKTLGFKEAAAIPLVGLTAWQGLYDHGELKKGQTVLIHAGAGGVGSIAIAFAKNTGAKVYTTASTPNHDYVKSLGADIIIDYQKENFVQKMKTYEPNGVDLVLDCVGDKILEESYQVVKSGGRLVSIVNPINQELAKKYQLTGVFFMLKNSGKDLTSIAQLIDSGKIKIPEIKEYPLSQISDAWKQIQTHHTRGKLVLKIT